MIFPFFSFSIHAAGLAARGRQTDSAGTHINTHTKTHTHTHTHTHSLRNTLKHTHTRSGCQLRGSRGINHCTVTHRKRSKSLRVPLNTHTHTHTYTQQPFAHLLQHLQIQKKIPAALHTLLQLCVSLCVLVYFA